MSVGQFTREIENGMIKQQAGAASEFIFTGYWNHEIQVEFAVHFYSYSCKL